MCTAMVLGWRMCFNINYLKEIIKMKKEIHYLILAVVILLSTFACETRLPFDDNGGNGSENSSNGGAVTINAKIENGDPLVYVVQVEYSYKDNIAYGRTENGRLIIDLPAIVLERYLTQIVGSPTSLWNDIVSDKYAKRTRYRDISGINKDGKTISFRLRPLTSELVSGEYWYFDRDCSMKGTAKFDVDETYDCSFKKGWNLVYLTGMRNQWGEYSVVSVSTQKPSNLTFGWFWYLY